MRALALLTLVSACQTSYRTGDKGAGEGEDRDSLPPDTTAGETDADGDADSDSDTDSDTDTTTVPPQPIVRFVALGDAGEGNDEQYAVADAIKTVCDRDGCDFALYLGDNFYDSGVDSVDDAQFDEKFELPYAELAFPFYPVLGNHDYGGEGVGWELWLGEIYVEYSDYSDKWTMPDLYYAFEAGDALFLGLDTTQVFWGITDDQLGWVQQEVSATDRRWKIAYGHHPYLSNGPHGNAGEYEGLDWVPIVNGESVRDFVDDGICGQVDLYLCGHDHSMQWPETTCDTEFIVSGAGAKTTEIEGDDPTHFEYDGEGFFWIEIVGDQLTGVAYDASANELFRRTITHR
jgi:tartrate-resistant acid phosphatase type 5